MNVDRARGMVGLLEPQSDVCNLRNCNSSSEIAAKFMLPEWVIYKNIV